MLENETTGEKLDFTGTTVAAGHYYDIDCRYGRKSVKDEAGTNEIADLTSDSDLATFHLAAEPEAGGGVNSLRLTGSAVTTATKVELTYDTRYLGI